jgi:hypothetical protein
MGVERGPTASSAGFLDHSEADGAFGAHFSSGISISYQKKSHAICASMRSRPALRCPPVFGPARAIDGPVRVSTPVTKPTTSDEIMRHAATQAATVRPI